MKTKVFISHSSKDKEVAGEVCQFLEAHGVSCWIAPRNVTPGKNYGAAIVDAIDECGVFVLILSGESNQSGQVVREVERAAAANAVIIPFRIENIQPSRDLEFYVSSSHWLDAVGPSRDKHLNELLSAITSWHGREKQSSTTTSSAAPGATAAAPLGSRKIPMIPLLITGTVVILLAVIYFVGRSSKPAVSVSPPVAAASPMSTPSITPMSTAYFDSKMNRDSKDSICRRIPRWNGSDSKSSRCIPARNTTQQPSPKSNSTSRSNPQGAGAPLPVRRRGRRRSLLCLIAAN